MNPLSKSKIKYIKSLQLKKNRIREGKFIVEGSKSVLEFLHSDFVVTELVATPGFYATTDNSILPAGCFVADADVLSLLGTYKSNDAALAVVNMPEQPALELKDNEVALALDQLNDPGNLGTIIRIADWFGIKKLLLSTGSVDIYNPKVVNASKGSFTRVAVHYVDLPGLLAGYRGKILAADLHGQPLTEMKPLTSGIIIMGSESHGLSADLVPFISQRLTIPRQGGAESLNVAVATGIICYHLVGQDG